LSAIKESERRLDNKLADFKADVRQAQDEAATKAVSKMRHDKPYEYKKKSHEEQARFNAQVEETVQEAQEALTALEEFAARSGCSRERCPTTYGETEVNKNRRQVGQWLGSSH
jgi:exonuclease VII large subunit